MMRWLLSTTVVAAGVALAAGSAQAVSISRSCRGAAPIRQANRRPITIPYMAANPDINIINDDNAAEGLAKVRAQVESEQRHLGHRRHGSCRRDYRV